MINMMCPKIPGHPIKLHMVINIKTVLLTCLNYKLTIDINFFLHHAILYKIFRKKNHFLQQNGVHLLSLENKEIATKVMIFNQGNDFVRTRRTGLQR